MAVTPQKQREYWETWNAKRPHYDRERRTKLRKEALALYGSVCKRCGFADPRALQLDHVNGGGCVERRSGKKFNGVNLYSELVRGIRDRNDFQLLCANCNWIKRAENNEHLSYTAR